MHYNRHGINDHPGRLLRCVPCAPFLVGEDLRRWKGRNLMMTMADRPQSRRFVRDLRLVAYITIGGIVFYCLLRLFLRSIL
jgi:hypothetical protein